MEVGSLTCLRPGADAGAETDPPARDGPEAEATYRPFAYARA
jgi:hypothetical protein